MNQPVRPELDRAWEQYFNQRGGEGVAAPAQVLPVVVMDVNPLGASRLWMAGTTLAALAANFNYIGIVNNDPVGQKSIVVVDEIFFRHVTGNEVVIGVSDQVTTPLGTLADVSDVAAEKDPGGFFGASISNVKRGLLQQVAGVGSSLFPANGVNVNRVPGPFILGPQANVFVRTLAVNEGIVAFFRGRYYPNS